MFAAELVVFACALAGASTTPDASASARKLVIDGTVEPISKFPFVANLVLCSGGFTCILDRYSYQISEYCNCRSFCTGALISPGSVLTAAHCIHDQAIRSKLVMNLTDIREQMAVVLGSELKTAKTENFYMIENIANAGWSNLRQTFDNDVALLFLKKCAAREYYPVKVATSNDFGGYAACRRVVALGFGREKTFPKTLWSDLESEVDPRLKATEDIVHHFDSCAKSIAHAYEDQRNILDFTGEGAMGYNEDNMSAFVSRDRTLCFGGNTTSGVCHGDSGGPIVAKAWGQWVIVGVNSFVIGTCGVYADFGSRVPFYADWIAEQLAAHDTCRDAKYAFLGWPVPKWQASEEDKSTHCHQEGVRWACPNDGTCIAWSKHCDGQPDCSYGEDEFMGCEVDHFKHMCPPAVQKFKNVMEASKSGFWEAYDTYSWEYSRSRNRGGSVTNSTHKAVSEKCESWLWSLRPLIRMANFTAAEGSILYSCISVDPEINGMDSDWMKIGTKKARSLASVTRVLQGCADQIKFTGLFIDGRLPAVQNFAENIQRCDKHMMCKDVKVKYQNSLCCGNPMKHVGGMTCGQMRRTWKAGGCCRADPNKMVPVSS